MSTVTTASHRATGTSDNADAKNRIAFIDIGRVIAALFVFYAHVDAFYVREEYGSTAFDRAVHTVLAEPFGFERYGFGAAGLGFFFLASGFVVTPIALKMGGWRFCVNRSFRLYPLVFVVVLFSALMGTFGVSVLETGAPPDVTVTTVVSNMALINFSSGPHEPLVGVAWTLAVEILYYATIILVLPFLHRWVWLAIAVQLELVFIAILLTNQFGDNYAFFGSQMAYVLIPIMGQIVWAGWTRNIPPWCAALFLGVSLVMFTWADPLGAMHDHYGMRSAHVTVALLVFLAGLGLERHLRQRWYWGEASERVYSLYLVHGVVVVPVVHALHGNVPAWVALSGGVLATLLMVEVSYRVIERPSHNLGRRLSGRRQHDDRHPRGRRHRADRRSVPATGADDSGRPQRGLVARSPDSEPDPGAAITREIGRVVDRADSESPDQV